MKYFSIITILLICCFTSCDGKQRVNQTNQEKLENSNLTKSFFERVEYFPKEYTEVKTDTTLSNGYRIKIAFYSDMDNTILNDFKIDTIHYKHYYREFKGDLSIIINDKVVFNKTIDKSYFTDNLNEMFWQNSIMGNISLDEDKTTHKLLYFNVFFCIPESEICKDYNIIIDNNGKSKIEELETDIH